MDFNIREEEQAVVDLARKILEDHATNERLKELEAGEADHDPDLWKALADAEPARERRSPRPTAAWAWASSALCLFHPGDRACGGAGERLPVTGARRPADRRCDGSEELKKAWLPEIARGERIVTAALGRARRERPAARRRRGPSAGWQRLPPDGREDERRLPPSPGFSCDRARTRRRRLDRSVPRRDRCRARASSWPRRRPPTAARMLGSRSSRRRGRRRRAARCRTGDGADGAAASGRSGPSAARCMMQLGVTERALEMTASYGRERDPVRPSDRKLPGRAPARGRRLHQRGGDSPQRASRRCGGSRTICPSSDHVAVAKYWAAEGGHHASYACQHLHGGIGIDVDYPLHRHFKWAIQIEHELGSATHHLDRLGRRFAVEGIPAD